MAAVPKKNILPSDGSSNGRNAGEKVRLELGLAMQPSLHAIDVRRWAQDAGFHEAGVVALPHSEADRDARRFADWIEAGRSFHIEMRAALHARESSLTAQ